MSNLVLFCSIVLIVGCSVKEPKKEEIGLKVQRLEALIINLDSNIQKEEAYDVARSSIVYSYALAKEYEALSSPWWQNTLVNVGIKKRGLCHEWAEDLLRFLAQKEYKSLEFHTIGANIGYLNEHNALSVAAKGESVKNSIVLDAWRDSGSLYFNKINEDKEYKWKERFNLYGVLPSRKMVK